MKLVCDLRDYRGDADNLLCVIDTKNSTVCWPNAAGANVDVKSLLEGRLLAIYIHKGGSTL